jgi:hypothetical protein
MLELLTMLITMRLFADSLYTRAEAIRRGNRAAKLDDKLEMMQRLNQHQIELIGVGISCKAIIASYQEWSEFSWHHNKSVVDDILLTYIKETQQELEEVADDYFETADRLKYYESKILD